MPILLNYKEAEAARERLEDGEELKRFPIYAIFPGSDRITFFYINGEDRPANCTVLFGPEESWNYLEFINQTQRASAVYCMPNGKIIKVVVQLDALCKVSSFYPGLLPYRNPEI